MLFATPDDMRDAFGKEEVAVLVSRHEYSGLPAPERAAEEEKLLQATLEKASNEAASYLSWRYPVFCKQTLPDNMSIPPAVVGVVCDIARYRLTGSGVTETETIAARYAAALDWLKSLASGKTALPGMAEEKQPEEGVCFIPGSRHFIGFPRSKKA